MANQNYELRFKRIIHSEYLESSIINSLSIWPSYDIECLITLSHLFRQDLYKTKNMLIFMSQDMISNNLVYLLSVINKEFPENIYMTNTIVMIPFIIKAYAI